MQHDFSRRVVGCIYPKNKMDAATGQAQGVVHILRNEGRCSCAVSAVGGVYTLKIWVDAAYRYP